MEQNLGLMLREMTVVAAAAATTATTTMMTLLGESPNVSQISSQVRSIVCNFSAIRAEITAPIRQREGEKESEIVGGMHAFG